MSRWLNYQSIIFQKQAPNLKILIRNKPFTMIGKTKSRFSAGTNWIAHIFARVFFCNLYRHDFFQLVISKKSLRFTKAYQHERIFKRFAKMRASLYSNLISVWLPLHVIFHMGKVLLSDPEHLQVWNMSLLWTFCQKFKVHGFFFEIGMQFSQQAFLLSDCTSSELLYPPW